MEKIFNLALGESELLSGKQFSQYQVVINDDSMICKSKKTDEEVTINFSSFTSAEFGIGSGNLWLQCTVDGKKFTFTAPRKEWKGESGQLIIKKINEVTEIKDMKEYKKYTGPFFFIYIFK